MRARVKNDYPDDWDARRRRVYQRDNYQCQNCGRKGGPRGDHELHAHHNVPKSKGGTHKMSNLSTLCKGCHNAIHHDGKVAPTVSSSSNTGVGWKQGLKRLGLVIIAFYGTALTLTYPLEMLTTIMTLLVVLLTCWQVKRRVKRRLIPRPIRKIGRIARIFK